MLEHLCLYLLFFILPYENLCCVFTTRTHDLSLFFMPLQKARRETLATLTTLKEVTSSMAFATESGSQNFIIFLSKIETTIIGTKAVLCVCVCVCVCVCARATFDQLDPDISRTSWWQTLTTWLQPLLLPAQFPCMGSDSKRVGHQGCAQRGFHGLFIMPLLISWWLWSFLAVVQRPWCLLVLLAPQSWAKETSSSGRSHSHWASVSSNCVSVTMKQVNSSYDCVLCILYKIPLHNMY